MFCRKARALKGILLTYRQRKEMACQSASTYRLVLKEGYTSLQVKMETAVVDEVKSFMKIDGISWNDLLTACFTKIP
jgi:hypothetical protein